MYKCDICGCTETHVEEYNHKYSIKDRSVEFKHDRRFCNKCHNFVYDKELDSDASTQAIEEYNKKYGIIPQKIIALRKEFGLSQEAFAKIIGCAKKTLISYEQGKAIPNDIYLIVIKTLVDNPEVIPLLVDSNKDLYKEYEYEKIINKFEYFTKKQNEISDLDGYTDFNKYKICYILNKLADKGIYKTKLLKEMFYCDYCYYKNMVVGITGLQFKKFKYGPVPVNYEEIYIHNRKTC